MANHMETNHDVFCSVVVDEEYLTPPPDRGTRYHVSKGVDGKSFD